MNAALGPMNDPSAQTVGRKTMATGAARDDAVDQQENCPANPSHNWASNHPG
ncbi:MAG: hypothetical protein WB762_18930 [Candidatus Sulfotelmatobacter sp.]